MSEMEEIKNNNKLKMKKNKNFITVRYLKYYLDFTSSYI